MHLRPARSIPTNRLSAKLTRSPALTLRRCACGGTPGVSGECEDCKKKRTATLQRAAFDTAPVDRVPGIVHAVLGSSGQPLDADTRSLMEPRFQHDFGQVRIHTDERAAESAGAVNALAYTVGKDVVFGAGQYLPSTSAGQRLIAHELTHVVQQSQAGGTRPQDLTIGAAEDAGEREAQQVSQSLLQDLSPLPPPQVQVSNRLNRAPAPPMQLPATGTAAKPGLLAPPPAPDASTVLGGQVRPHGPNPADAMTPLCAQIAQPPFPTTDEGLRQRVRDWLAGALAAVKNGAAASNASHAAEIQANNETEIQAEADTFLRDFDHYSQAERNAYRRQSVDWLQLVCQRVQRETRMEFQYNVVFEKSNPPWGFQNAEWDTIEGALEALPVEATWMNPTLLRFSRQACHPDDIDASGQCTGTGAGPIKSFVGGDTDTSTPGVAKITIYNAGLGQNTYGRSTNLGLAKTDQSIRHEVGHAVEGQFPLAARNAFFDNVMGWRTYSWISINQPATNLGQAERLRLCTDAQMLAKGGACDPARLTAFLALLPNPDSRTALGQRTYIRSNDTLNSILTAQAPAGEEFSYALTNRGDYFAELYTFAVSRPEWLHTVLTAEQIAWWKENVFHTPVDLNVLASQVALKEPQRSEFLTRGRRLFTREQLSELLNRLMLNASPSSQGGQLA